MTVSNYVAIWLFQVFHTQMMQLLSWVPCKSCNLPGIHWKPVVDGTLLLCKGTCSECGASNQWQSQPRIGKIAAGNVMLSASILFSGATAGKTLRILNHLGKN
jgi:hypothetical protein